MTQVARATDLSRESLYKALRRTSNPSLDTALRVAKVVGVRLRAEAA
ncbi:MAG: DNA-binding protein [Planctomycetota bacterium]